MALCRRRGRESGACCVLVHQKVSLPLWLGKETEEISRGLTEEEGCAWSKGFKHRDVAGRDVANIAKEKRKCKPAQVTRSVTPAAASDDPTGVKIRRKVRFGAKHSKKPRQSPKEARNRLISLSSDERIKNCGEWKERTRRSESEGKKFRKSSEKAPKP